MKSGCKPWSCTKPDLAGNSLDYHIPEALCLLGKKIPSIFTFLYSLASTVPENATGRIEVARRKLSECG